MLLLLNEVHIENFKALKNVDLKLSKFNIITGLNSAGKTSVSQAIVLLKQSILRREIIYNDYLLRLGDYREMVHLHDTRLPIRISLNFKIDNNDVTYDTHIMDKRIQEDFLVGKEKAWSWDSGAPGTVEPYHRVFLSQAASGYGGGQYKSTDAAYFKRIVGLQGKVSDWFNNALYLSVVRGFTKYSYPLLAGPPSIEEVSKRAGDLSLLEEWLSNLILYKINEAKRYPAQREALKKMSERLGTLGIDVSPYVLGGPSVVIDLIEKDMWVSAVNSGYGVNQSVPSVVLGTLSAPGTLVMIEEPEIHLHPVMQRKMTRILAEIANEDKQILMTCHSDHIVLALKKLVNEKLLSPDDVKIYHYERPERESQITEVKITDSEESIKQYF